MCVLLIEHTEIERESTYDAHSFVCGSIIFVAGLLERICAIVTS